MTSKSLHWPAHALMLSLPLITVGLALPVARAHAAETITATATDTTTPGYPATESIDDCMRKWDPGTHMSRESWRASCQRIKNERAPYVKNQ